MHDDEGEPDRTDPVEWLPRPSEPALTGAAIWLLRAGIDHRGRLELNRLWGIAIRVAVLVDLHLAGRFDADEADSPDQQDAATFDTTPTGVAHLDAAIDSLISSAGQTDLDWIRRGRYEARVVAADLVASGEWTYRPSLTASGWVRYRAQPNQYVSQRTTLAHVLDGEILPSGPTEAVVAVLGNTLQVIRVPDKQRKQSSASTITPDACGEFERIVATAMYEILQRHAAAQANSNPTW